MKLKGFKSTNVLGYNVFSSSLEIINPDVRNLLINTFSPNSYGLALRDKYFEESLKNSDILLLDGIGIALGSILINGKDIKKIAGQDCFDFLINKANTNQWKVFFIGSSNETLGKIITRLKLEYPNITASAYSPPFKEHFTDNENKLMIDRINAFEPDILFVGMTAPKQEKWAYKHRYAVNVRIISTIGNVFDWYAGNSKRPSKIWIQLRLEWLARIFLRPEILQRNTKNQMIYLRDLFLHILKIKTIR
jgi:N-acetylglucosaminyldiphosphoundecaprenol N-acetyl-beta-D-mannosaminyltransferase